MSGFARQVATLVAVMCTASLPANNDCLGQVSKDEDALPADLTQEEFQSSEINFDAEIGPSEPLASVTVDLKLIPSKQTVAAGEPWTVFGQISNRSERPVWIVDTRAVFVLPDELWGLAEGLPLFAYFPTTDFRLQDEIARIEPGASYIVFWEVNPTKRLERDQRGESAPASSIRRVLSRQGGAFWSFLFFRPGEYTVAASVGVWATPPKVVGNTVINTGESFTLSETLEVSIETSPWVLMAGAIAGGLVCFVLRLMLALRRSTLQDLGGLRYVASGFAMAILLCSIGTVLLSRISGSEFLVSVTVRDVWGAVATGFIIQWLGLTYVVGQLVSPGDAAAQKAAQEKDKQPAPVVRDQPAPPEAGSGAVDDRPATE